jgi:hypothetical protein
MSFDLSEVMDRLRKIASRGDAPDLKCAAKELLDLVEEDRFVHVAEKIKNEEGAKPIDRASGALVDGCPPRK